MHLYTAGAKFSNYMPFQMPEQQYYNTDLGNTKLPKTTADKFWQKTKNR